PRRAEKYRASACGSRVRRRDRIAHLVRIPRRELRGGLRDDEQRHLRMLRPAILGAWRAKDPRTVRLNRQFTGVARNQIRLAVQVRRPEAVNDVARFEPEQYGPSNGNVNLVRGFVQLRTVGRLILDFPTTMMADETDVERE